MCAADAAVFSITRVAPGLPGAGIARPSTWVHVSTHVHVSTALVHVSFLHTQYTFPPASSLSCLSLPDRGFS